MRYKGPTTSAPVSSAHCTRFSSQGDTTIASLSRNTTYFVETCWMARLRASFGDTNRTRRRWRGVRSIQTTAKMLGDDDDRGLPDQADVIAGHLVNVDTAERVSRPAQIVQLL